MSTPAFDPAAFQTDGYQSTPSDARLTQYAREALVHAVARARVSQYGIETLATGMPTVARVTQYAREVLEVPVASARVSQVGRETLLALPIPPSNARVTQYGLEVLVVL